MHISTLRLTKMEVERSLKDLIYNYTYSTSNVSEWEGASCNIYFRDSWMYGFHDYEHQTLTPEGFPWRGEAPRSSQDPNNEWKNVWIYSQWVEKVPKTCDTQIHHFVSFLKNPFPIFLLCRRESQKFPTQLISHYFLKLSRSK